MVLAFHVYQAILRDAQSSLESRLHMHPRHLHLPRLTLLAVNME